MANEKTNQILTRDQVERFAAKDWSARNRGGVRGTSVRRGEPLRSTPPGCPSLWSWAEG